MSRHDEEPRRGADPASCGGAVSLERGPARDRHGHAAAERPLDPAEGPRRAGREPAPVGAARGFGGGRIAGAGRLAPARILRLPQGRRAAPGDRVPDARDAPALALERGRLPQPQVAAPRAGPGAGAGARPANPLARFVGAAERLARSPDRAIWAFGRTPRFSR